MKREVRWRVGESPLEDWRIKRYPPSHHRERQNPYFHIGCPDFPDTHEKPGNKKAPAPEGGGGWRRGGPWQCRTAQMVKMRV